MLEKPASNHYPVSDVIRRRWSPRVFDPDRAVAPELLASLFEAARWAASSGNRQPWHFLVARKEEPEAFAHAVACLNESNRVWAQYAPLLAFSVAQVTIDGNAQRHAFYGVGLAVGNLIVEAISHDLFVRQMAGYSIEKVMDTYGIPPDYEPVTAIAIGYRWPDESNLPESLRERELAERIRKPLPEFVFGAKWGEAADLTK